MHLHRFGFGFVFLTLISIAGLAQTRQFQLMRHYGRDKGLSHQWVTSMTQDPQGFLWVGTMEGLNRFDGYRFDSYRQSPGSLNSITHNIIYTLTTDQEGMIWVGTNNGLNRFDPASGVTDVYLPQKDGTGLVHKRVRALFCDSNHQIWVGTEDGINLIPADRSGIKTLTLENPDLLKGRIRKFLQDPSGFIWIATQHHLIQLDPNNGEVLFQVPGDINDIALDKSGLLWVATAKGLQIWDVANRKATVPPGAKNALALFRDMAVRNVLADRYGQIWIGSKSYLVRLDLALGQNIEFATPDMPMPGLIRAFFEDRDGLIWIATDRGVFLYNKAVERFQYFGVHQEPRKGLSEPSVTAVLESNDGFIWLGTYFGLNRFDPFTQTFKRYFHGNNEPHSDKEFVVALMEKPDRNLWVATGDGLFTFDVRQERFIPFESQAELSNPFLQCLLASDRTLWVGSNQGLNRIDLESGDISVYYPTGRVRRDENTIYSLVSGGPSELWVGTRAGLYHFNEGDETFRSYRADHRDAQSLSGDMILCLIKDSKDRLWAGTDSGISRLEDPLAGRFFNLNEQDGMPSSFIYSIQEDRLGYFWIGTNNGLCRYDEEQQRFTNFSVYDGLQDNEFNQGSSFRARDGNLIFGGPAGFNIFNPLTLRENQVDFPVYITRLRLDNNLITAAPNNEVLPKSLNHMSEVSIPSSNQRITFEFSGLAYQAPGEVRYSYRLEGHDPDWVSTDSLNRQATYTDLAPGHYAFRVKAGAGDTEDRELALDVHITGPFWLRPMFGQIAVALLLLISVILAWRLIAARRRSGEQSDEIDKKISDFLANTSHELRTPLNGIIGVTEALLEGGSGSLTDVQRTKLELVVTSGRRLAGLVDNILDYAKVTNKEGTIQTETVLLRPLVETVLGLLEPRLSDRLEPLVVENHIPNNFPELKADPHALQQIITNLLDNAIKFTPKGSITIDARAEGREAVISVADTGIGIPKHRQPEIFKAFRQLEGATIRFHEGAGLGLSIVKQLVEEHHGRIWVSADEGKGSTFFFTIPLVKGVTTDIQDKVSVILVVDDDPINRLVVRELLSHKHMILEAENGTSALRTVAENKVDLILMDVMMPGMSGYEVCRTLRESHGPKELPILFLTARNQQADLARGYEAGGSDFLVKPIDKTELRMRVDTHLSLVTAKREVDATRQQQRILIERNLQLSKARDHLQEAASTDPLTGLYNRRFAQNYIEQEVAKVMTHYEMWLHQGGTREEALRHNLVFYLMDMDHFKQVNDTYGHDAGDVVLKDLSEIMRKTSRGTDLLVRWGGEEFLIISPQENRQFISTIAERYREAVAQHVFALPSGETIQKTCSIGFATYPFIPYRPDACGWEDVILAADVCLNAVKAAGRNGWAGLSAGDEAPVQGLFSDFQHRVDQMVKDGVLSVETSKDSLSWNEGVHP